MKNLRKISVIVLICFVMNMLLINTVTATESVSSGDYDIEWNAEDMPLGAFTEYNGLSCVASDELTVTDSSRTYNNVTYTQTIKTNGSSSVNSNFIPTKRALKFTTTQPCYIKILAYGTSTGTTTQPMYISKSGSLVNELSLNYSELTENIVFLNSADTYYIYCLNGSIGVCYINIYRIQGDLNGNAFVDKDDMTLLRQILLNNSGIQGDILENADVNTDCVINETDFTLLSQLVSSYGNYVPTYYSNKTWDFDDYEWTQPIVYSEETDVDGILIIPAANNANTEHMYMSRTGEKYYNDIVHTAYIKTCGQMRLNDDKTGKYRSLSMFTSEPCYMTVFVRSSNTEQDNSPNLTVTRKNEIVAECSLLSSAEQSTEIMQVVTVHLDRPDQYYIGNTTGGLYIYSIMLTPLNKNITSNAQLNITKDEVIELIVEGNALLADSYYYILEYDENKLYLEKIKTQSRGISNEKYGVTFSYNIENIFKLSSGGYIFRIDNTTNNWSGVVAILRFKAIDNGSVTVKCTY